MLLKKFMLIGALSVVTLSTSISAEAADNTYDKPLKQVEVKPTTGMKVDTLVGKYINNNSGEKIGEIESVIIGKKGQIAAVIVSVGGFLGMGDHVVAIEWSDLKTVLDSGEIQTNLTKNDLKVLPKYKYEKPEYKTTIFHDDRYGNKGDRSKIEVDNLIGTDVSNNSGEKIGEIESVIIGKNGQIAAVIVGVGGFVGISERVVAIDWSDLQTPLNSAEIQTNLTKDDLKKRPEYKYEKLGYRSTIFHDERYNYKRNHLGTK